MYRVIKALNHNAAIVLAPDNKSRFLVLGKGVGFGRKISEKIELPDDAICYSLASEATDRGTAESIIKHINPECLEIAGEILNEAQKAFGKVDRQILFSMADHLSFAINRMQKGEKISNPLCEDIRLLFPREYEVASKAVELVQKMYDVALNEDEVGFLALHVHSSIENESVSMSLQTAQVIRMCIDYLEEKTGRVFEVSSLEYNRMMNHIRFMVARMEAGEHIKMNLNDYMSANYPDIFEISEEICNQISKFLRKDYSDSEKGYLAMHIARVMGIE